MINFLLNFNVDTFKCVDDPLRLLVRVQPVEERFRKLWKFVVLDRLPHISHQLELEGNIVDGDQAAGDGLVDDRVDERSRVALAGAAGALRVNWRQVFFVLLVPQVQLSASHQRAAEPCRPRWEHTVEHVDAQRHADDQVRSESDAHQVARLVARQQVRREAHNFPEVVFALAARQSADSEASNVPLRQSFRALLSQLRLEPALYNREDRLIVVPAVCLEAPVDPSDGPLHRFLHSRTRRGGFHDVVELHDDVGTDGVLQVDRFLRCQHAFGPIER